MRQLGDNVVALPGHLPEPPASAIALAFRHHLRLSQVEHSASGISTGMVEQRIEQEGSGNIGVQVAGDHNTVVIGAYRLTLTRYTNRADAESDIGLLTPFTRAIDLIGRGQELADLEAWLGKDKPTSVRVLTGGAGVGKTRLALELMERAGAQGWQAGFVRRNELTRIGHGEAPMAPGKPVLAVVDYAAAHAQVLNAWLEELADPPPGAAQPKFRLLLLERQAEPGSGWWETAFGLGGSGARAIRRLLDPPEPVSLRPLGDAGDRRAVFQAMFSRKDSTVAAPDDPTFERRLGDAGLRSGGDPLFLMMAALKAAEVGCRPCSACRGRTWRSSWPSARSSGSPGSRQRAVSIRACSRSWPATSPSAAAWSRPPCAR
jgi:hypothetical protein